ncbi:hypothetical protein P9362_21770, partial [Escherichia coli]
NFFFSLWHLCCSEVSISPLFRWPNSVCHFKLKTTVSKIDQLRKDIDAIVAEIEGCEVQK